MTNMYSQYRFRVFTFIALLFLDPRVAALSTTTSGCTVRITTVVATTYIVQSEPRTRTSIVNLAPTYFLYITPFSNGTTLTRYELGKHAAGVSLKGRAEATATMYSASTRSVNRSITTTTAESFTIPSFVNSSTTDIPPQSSHKKSCLTQTYTATLTTGVIGPAASDVVTTLTVTTITVSTLFDYDYLVPATFQPILAEPTTSSGVMQNTQHVTTDPKASGNAPNAPAGQPSKTEDFPGKPTAPALPQGTPPGYPIATSGGPVRPIPGEPMRPPGGLPAIPVNPPATTTVLSPGELQTMSLPGLGAVVVEPSHSNILISGAASMIVPGQQTTIHNVAISFDTSASFVVIDGSATFRLPPPTPATRPAPVVFGGTTINVDEVATRLHPGEVTTINNIPISRDTSGSFVVIGGTQTIPLLEATRTTGPSTVIIDGTIIDVSKLASELEPGEVTMVGTMTISRDSSALVAGATTIAIGAAASNVVLGGTTISPGALPSGFSFIPATDGGGLLLPNGQTLMPGAMTTIGGIEVSLNPGETPVVVVEGSMSITASVTVDGGAGISINSGSEGFGQPTSTTTGVLADFTGGAVASVYGVWDALCTLAMTSLFFGIVQRLV